MVSLLTFTVAWTGRNPLSPVTADTKSLKARLPLLQRRGNLHQKPLPLLPIVPIRLELANKLQFVLFILFTKLKMTWLDTKRKGFPRTSYLITSTVHHTVNMFLLNYKKYPSPCKQLLSSEDLMENSVALRKTKRDCEFDAAIFFPPSSLC